MPLGSFSKDKLVFDPTAPIEGDNVGAFVRSADGDLITDHELMEAEYAGLISQGLIFRSKLPGAIGNTYSFEVIDTGGSGPLSFTEIAGAIVLDLKGLTPTKAAVVAALASNTYADISVGTPASGNVVVAAAQSFVNGEDHSYHHHLDVYSATADGFGNPITSTNGALDVNLKSPLVIDSQLEGVYSGGNTNPDNVGIIAHTRGASQGDAQQVERTTAAAPSADNIAAADVKGLDVNAFGMVWDGSNWDRMPGNSTDGVSVKITNSLTVTGDILDDDPDAGAKSIKVGSRSEWGALSALSADGDRGDLISDKYRRVYVNNGSNIAMRAAAVTAGVAQVELKSGGSRLEGRRLLMVQNLSGKEVYIGETGVTSSSGIVLAARASMSLDVGQDVAVFCLGSAAGLNLRVLELA
jgi:hypothetical protein